MRTAVMSLAPPPPTPPPALPLPSRILGCCMICDQIHMQLYICDLSPVVVEQQINTGGENYLIDYTNLQNRK